MPRAEGRFEVLERINNNAYKVDLPGEYQISATFNVVDLSPFYPDATPPDLRIKSFQQGEDDGILHSQDLDHDESSPTRPRTRSQVKKMAHILQEDQMTPNGLIGQKMPGFVH